MAQMTLDSRWAAGGSTLVVLSCFGYGKRVSDEPRSAESLV